MGISSRTKTKWNDFAAAGVGKVRWRIEANHVIARIHLDDKLAKEAGTNHAIAASAGFGAFGWNRSDAARRVLGLPHIDDHAAKRRRAFFAGDTRDADAARRLQFQFINNLGMKRRNRAGAIEQEIKRSVINLRRNNDSIVRDADFDGDRRRVRRLAESRR